MPVSSQPALGNQGWYCLAADRNQLAEYAGRARTLWPVALQELPMRDDHKAALRTHARASSALGAKYVPPFDFGDNGPGGWIILDEPELHLGPKLHILLGHTALLLFQFSLFAQR